VTHDNGQGAADGRLVPSALNAASVFGAVLFVFAVTFPPFDDATAVNLTVHMLQHVVIVLSGIAIAYPLHRLGLGPRWRSRSAGAALLLCFAATVYWHLPASWDAAVLNPWVHAAEHFSFLAVGLAIGSVLQPLSDARKAGALGIAFLGHMSYAILLIAPLGGVVYPLYSLQDQRILGWVLLLSGPFLLLGIAYLVVRNPRWIDRSSRGPELRPWRVSPRVPRGTWQSMSVALSATLVVYFAWTAVAAGAAASPAGSGATVYIQETPLSWNYSPQNITVVIGVNNSVTWVSHSVSYDTVTSSGSVADGPDSGVIGPGQSYTFVFEGPGTYQYHCVFHPWMVGYVIVKGR
jgi:plastocyanin